MGVSNIQADDMNTIDRRARLDIVVTPCVEWEPRPLLGVAGENDKIASLRRKVGELGISAAQLVPGAEFGSSRRVKSCESAFGI